MNHTTEIILTLAGIALVHGLIFFFLTRKSRLIKGKHVVVTGGSSGIGLWAAVECVRLGAHVTVIARNVPLLEKALEELEKWRVRDTQKLQFRSLDLSKSYETVAKTLDELEGDVGPIYMLVNCAGMAICGTVEDTAIADAHRLMDVNYFGTYYPTRHVLPKMKAAGDGIIVITASQAALMGVYGYGAYAASKFALRGLAETIAMEARHRGVTVTLALPADTDTPGFENENRSKPEETKIISGSGGLAKPEDVGRRIVQDALKGSFFSILGLESWILSILCVGMAPWKGPLLCFAQFYLLGPLRLIGLVLQWNFQRIIKGCAKRKAQQSQ
ncbi:short-chain dehydrogenase [Anopheles darlingi]|uniref:3-dehydrosphinganine reductase n=1 Tax=Anopheles darlingi TaxID=43151 RepID=W5J724_ANODA|nr:short-chain dehydrogenase [Anopheles darlingi]